ncbi:MAG: vanadium-dependent haloperoxidase [Daejeonella sp.]
MQKVEKFQMLPLLFVLLLAVSCRQAPNSNLSDTEILHQNQDQLTQVIIYDVFTPPVASRIYGYTSLASYEALRFSKPGSASIVKKLNDFPDFPQPQIGKKYNFSLAASQAFFKVVHKVVFSVDSLKNYEKKLFGQFENSLDPEVYKRSIAFGDSIGSLILQVAAKDGYVKSRGKPKFLGNENVGQWRPTPPDYMDGVEWCWGTMKPMLLDAGSLSENLPKPPKFSLDSGSVYYNEVTDLYKLTNNLSSEQKEIARYWDDNPFVVEHSGHMMFANKKITPGGHWMGIAAIAAKQANADAVQTAKVYAVTSVALYDAFICCWNLKYKYNTIRPVTVINEHIDNNWQPMLQTPPFPEYPSGHSTITRAAATVLTKMFGENFAFEDTSDLKYIGMKRKFKSFIQASDEASISRVYGGIHYRFSVDEGVKEGKKVGDMVAEKLNL